MRYGTRWSIGLAAIAGLTLIGALTGPAAVAGDPPQSPEPWHKYASTDRSTYLSAWQDRYPTSTLPDRMAAAAGQTCYLCHQPSGRGDRGNCYREDLKARLDGGLTIEQALDALDALDSDGDGVPNGEEILLVRHDDPTQIGYNPGLIGPTGTSPCSADPAAPITGQPETPVDACYADCDGTGTLDFFDFLCFQNAFATGDPYADCDGTGVLDFFDFLCFQNEFAAGCP
ncbi:MAG: GC-type dockerin domain-anchored protein [Phycisphaerales bacterium JB039]